MGGTGPGGHEGAQEQAAEGQRCLGQSCKPQTHCCTSYLHDQSHNICQRCQLHSSDRHTSAWPLIAASDQDQQHLCLCCTADRQPRQVRCILVLLAVHSSALSACNSTDFCRVLTGLGRLCCWPKPARQQGQNASHSRDYVVAQRQPQLDGKSDVKGR